MSYRIFVYDKNEISFFEFHAVQNIIWEDGTFERFVISLWGLN